MEDSTLSATEGGRLFMGFVTFVPTAELVILKFDEDIDDVAYGTRSNDFSLLRMSPASAGDSKGGATTTVYGIFLTIQSFP